VPLKIENHSLRFTDKRPKSKSSKETKDLKINIRSRKSE